MIFFSHLGLYVSVMFTATLVQIFYILSAGDKASKIVYPHGSDTFLDGQCHHHGMEKINRNTRRLR